MRLPLGWSRARATLAIAALVAAAFVLVHAAGLDARAQSWAGFMPYRFAFDGYAPGAPLALMPLTATLVHGGWIHLGFNLLILLLCGRAVEGVVGPFGILVLCVLGAYAAAAGHFLIEPRGVVPMVGASGVVASLIGAYAMLFGQRKPGVRNAALGFWLNALWLIAFWIGLQLLLAYVSARPSVGMAIGAHVGGFLLGMVLGRPLLLLRYRKA
jgi:membrane associated rhomboid family serine protease